ncbi:spermidine synthase [Geotalea sp. SG265]|uniref:spermidine synthase n=1 Tax=Geotalea sp. SG265 TaxID=2922867 RepID=UPI001FB03CA0|nr:spermidine synthase [Geotalea sp. SG265]
MALPWTIIDTVTIEEGELQLRRRGDDFLITVGGLVLMNSRANRSELALGRLACAHLQTCSAPRVLVGGLGMGCTLRAVLDTLPAGARVVVAELNPVILEWCRGPLAPLTDGAVNDPRVTVEIADVAQVIRRSRIGSGEEGFDAIVLDLYRGPHHRTNKRDDPLYGSKAVEHARLALKDNGIFAVWGENYDAGFDQRLRDGGFSVKNERPGRGGLRHVVFVARKLNA